MGYYINGNVFIWRTLRIVVSTIIQNEYKHIRMNEYV